MGSSITSPHIPYWEQHSKVSFASVEASATAVGEGGIRTPGAPLKTLNGLANRRFQPLSHLSLYCLGKASNKKLLAERLPG